MEKMKSLSSGHGVGRRKSSVARVWLKSGVGKISVNGKELESYFDTKINSETVCFPFKVSGFEKAFDTKINVQGGGLVGQAGAIKLGIARALLSTNESLRQVFRRHGLLTVDSRIKERKKYGQKGARKKFQFVKR